MIGPLGPTDIFRFYKLISVVPTQQLKIFYFSGLLNSLGWLIWYVLNRKLKYSWKCLATIISIDLLLLLELGDFPPIFWTVDAHALWHIGTIPLPFLWYR